MGITIGRTKGDAEAIPFMKRAIELDPNFAMAYAGLAVEYANLGQATLAAENARKAYSLRDRVSERERYRISAFYFQNVTGEVEKATEAYELWAKSYPRDMVPHVNLGVMYSALGQYDKAIAETETQQRLEPTIVGYGNLAAIYIAVNRLKEARQTLQEAQQKNFDGLALRAIFMPWHFCAGTTPKWIARSRGRQAVPAKKTRCLTLTPTPRPITAGWKKRATWHGVPWTPRCGRTPKKPALSGWASTRFAKLSLATSPLPGKALAAPWRSLRGVM